MKNKALENMKIKKLDDLYGIKGNEIQDIPIEELHDFKGHPFRVLMDSEDMDNLMESIKQNGVLTPGLCRKRKSGGYELISGHRRKYACSRLGISKMPMIVKDLDDDDAVIQMVDSNLQRDELLVSEKAMAYSMKYYALKNKGGNSLDTLSEESGDSPKTIQRLIHIARLTKEFLSLADSKELGLTQAYNLSFLKEVEQRAILLLFSSRNEKKISITIDQSTALKELSQNGEFTQEAALGILFPENGKKAAVRKVSFSNKRLSEYFDDSYTSEDIESILISLLEKWKENPDK